MGIIQMPLVMLLSKSTTALKNCFPSYILRKKLLTEIP